MTRQNVLVVGASGSVGSAIVKNLIKQDVQVKAATSRNPIEKTSPSNITEVHMNVITGEGVREAFEKVDQAFLMAPAGYADQHALLSPLIQEAKVRGVRKVVLLSAYGADADDTAPLRRAELELERSGIAYNVIRPNWFFQNFNTFWLKGIREQGKILLPVKDAKASFIDALDIGAVAAKLLLDEKLNNRTFNLTGAEAYSHSQVAEAISRVTGKEITYQEIEPETMRQSLLAAGLNAAYANFLLLILEYLAEGYNAEVNDNVKLILGKDPIRLAQYVENYRSAWV